jgi:hypothetical protein
MAGVPTLLASGLAGWPIVLSWGLTMQANEAQRSFLIWQLLFVAVNLAIGAVYLLQVPEFLASKPLMLSFAHAIILGTLVPLAIETSPPNGE